VVNLGRFAVVGEGDMAIEPVDIRRKAVAGFHRLAVGHFPAEHDLDFLGRRRNDGGHQNQENSRYQTSLGHLTLDLPASI